MNIEARKLIQEQYAKLPPGLQRAIQASNLHEKIIHIGQEHQLHVDQLQQLEDETLLLMMGFTDPDDFVDALTNELHLEQVKALGISNDIGQDILLPIRESLKQTDMTLTQTQPSPVEKSVVMPSKAAAMALGRTTGETAQPASPKAPAPQQTAQPQAQITASGGAPQNAVVPVSADPSRQGIAEADVMLTQPTISTPKPPAPPQAPQSAPPKPAPYKTDPYREPPE